MDGWTDRQIMESYSAIKNEEILPFAKTWMDPGDIKQSKTGQTEKDKGCMISLICEMLKKKLIEKKIRDGGMGKGNWRKVVERYKLPVISKY